jgi:hypothetical protein
LVLADTSVWVEHFRRAERLLEALLVNEEVLCHPLVVLEIACGTPPAPRERTLRELRKLQQAKVATSDEVLDLIERRQLHGAGCGAIDIALLASTILTAGTRLWTLDKRLAALASQLGIGYEARA